VTIRIKRWLLVVIVVLLAGMAAIAGLEWERRRQVAAAGTPSLDDSGMVVAAHEWEDQFRDPEAFAHLCADVTERSHAIQQRFLRLWHTRKTRQTRYDAKGKVEAVSEAVYRVHFEDGKERKQEIERRQVLGKPSFFDPDRIKSEEMDTSMSPPFSKESPVGLYRYRLEGVEELQGRRLLRIAFEPTRSVERSFRGSAWIDPDSREPVRIHGSLAKARLTVDRFDIILDYGPSENDHVQLRRVRMDMAGGFALVSLHYLLDSELSDYRTDDQ
jgi:hypothetical protein